LGDKIKKNDVGGACTAYGGEEKHIQGFGWGNQRERDHLGDPGIEGRKYLYGSSGTGMCGYGLDQAGSGQGHVADTRECGNETSGSIKCREFLD
jgi:hypothetical protein